MLKLISEFQNSSIPEDYNECIEQIFKGEKFEHRSRKAMSLGGAETLIIAIVGQISGTLLLRLIDYISNEVTQKFQLKTQADGKSYDFPKDKDEIIGKYDK